MISSQVFVVFADFLAIPLMNSVRSEFVLLSLGSVTENSEPMMLHRSEKLLYISEFGEIEMICE